MTHLSVFISQVSDGDMYNRRDLFDPGVIKNRETYLADRDITMEQTTRLNPDVGRRDKEEHEINWCRYIALRESDKHAGMRGADATVSDAITTQDAGHALMLPIADCIGTIFYDEAHHVLMLSHLGRHSLEQDGAIKSVRHLSETYGSRPEDIKVWMTPSASKEVFPIWALDNKGMKEVAFEQLAAAGILAENITDNPAETDKDPNYFSYTNFYNKRADIDADYMIVAMMSD